jgi:hypothetical protein
MTSGSHSGPTVLKVTLGMFRKQSLVSTVESSAVSFNTTAFSGIFSCQGVQWPSQPAARAHEVPSRPFEALNWFPRPM